MTTPWFGMDPLIQPCTVGTRLISTGLGALLKLARIAGLHEAP
ncbi:MAG: hypothetical protein U0359_02570 [Byssovorax sp.]